MEKHFILGVLLLQVAIPSRCYEEENPFLDLAASLIQNMGDGGAGNNNGLGALGSIVGSLMQGDNAKNLGDLFGQSENGDSNPAGDILSGLGSLLGGEDGKIDPNMIGSIASMVAKNVFKNVKTTTVKPKEEIRQKREERRNKEGDVDILGLASSLLGDKKVAAYLPLIMNTISVFAQSNLQEKAEEHHDHANFLPPYLEKAHLYWDLFINSDLGKAVWEKSGLHKATKFFVGNDGKINFGLMMKNFENQSFRRHWIKAAAQYLSETVIHMTKPEVYRGYLAWFEYVINGFLTSQGLPKNTQFNVKQPEKSITVLINHVLKNYLDMDTDVAGYVKQAVDYFKETLRMAGKATQSMASRGEHNALVERVTDTLNLEVIEPVLRVYRAYKHSLQAPHCQEHLMCLVNRHHDSDKHGLPGFKAGLTKLSSLVASAALSFQDGKGFYDLYNAIQNDVNCEAKYPADCAAFHEHELKVTTEVYHRSDEL